MISTLQWKRSTITTEPSHTIYTAQEADGTFFAVSTDTPRFCFAGPTEADVCATAERALEFYRKTRKAR